MKFHQICPVGAELFHAGGRMEKRTDVTKLLVAFRDFADAPQIHCVCVCVCDQYLVCQAHCVKQQDTQCTIT